MPLTDTTHTHTERHANLLHVIVDGGLRVGRREGRVSRDTRRYHRRLLVTGCRLIRVEDRLGDGRRCREYYFLSTVIWSDETVISLN